MTLMLDSGNKCPQCGKDQMPKWSKDPQTAQSARACQACGFVQARPPVQTGDKKPAETERPTT